MPIFAEDYAAALHSLYRLAEVTPEIVRHLIRNIQPPTVDIKFFYPIQADIYEKFLYALIGSVEFGHVVAYAEIFIVGILYLVAVNYKPIEVWRIFAVFDHIFKLWKSVRTVIEHGIENYLYPSRVRLFYKSFKYLLIAEVLVDLIVIAYIILVV